MKEISVLGLQIQKQATNGNGNHTPNVIQFQKAVEENDDVAPDLSRTNKFLLKAGAVMTVKKEEGNQIRVNPTVVSLVVTLFGVLVVLGGFVYNYAVFSTSFENEKKKWEVLEKRLEKIETIQRDQEIKKAEINGYQIGKTEKK